jgi:hypothetical protein
MGAGPAGRCGANEISLEPNPGHGALGGVFLAVIRQAAEAASNADGPFHGYPPWIIVLVGALVLALGLWIFGKLLKLALWFGIIVVLIGGVILAAKMLTGG